MSRTAGVGMQDYAAVNNLAVTAAVLGLASFLAVTLRDLKLLALIPLAAVTFGLIGLIQVSRSNRTQTGGLLAIAGLTLGVGCGGYLVYSSVNTLRQMDRHRAEVRQVLEQFAALTVDRKFDAAYALFSRRFQERISRDTFDTTLDRMQSGAFYGLKMTGGEAGQRVLVERDGTTGQLRAVGLFTAQLKATTDLPGAPPFFEESVNFVREPEGWRIESMPTFFPVEQPRAR
jgi:hypothetical protein